MNPLYLIPIVLSSISVGFSISPLVDKLIDYSIDRKHKRKLENYTDKDRSNDCKD